ncbi:uncharacterized protein LOC124274571 [Haliotis rubra]|uniref:uncharacterized protein LOC124274571 n=1 Tax=Haliotis rubra TaxID=36100 RepID=UPI001EE57D9F|nr:uncharacterized protein LOC124274571 [Haliotis rubra]
MFERAVFLLCLPAICFSFALFPYYDHETQRRQIPEDQCIESLTPCIHYFRYIHTMEGPQNIVVDGRIALPCESRILEGFRNCTDVTRQCNEMESYMTLRLFYSQWNFICQNSQAFVAGEKCLNNSMLQSSLSMCRNYPDDMCLSTCVRERVAETPDCSTDDSILLGRLMATALEQLPGRC